MTVVVVNATLLRVVLRSVLVLVSRCVVSSEVMVVARVVEGMPRARARAFVIWWMGVLDFGPAVLFIWVGRAG